jgi:catechol 2,3-dioxygenase-like lactoylglutathione lyase family enzyme
MKSESAVEFATTSRIHVALAVNNLEQSKAFYRSLFGHGPTKERPRYAKFEVAEPPVNLAINEADVFTAPSNAVAHFGVQLKSTAAVHEIADRLAKDGFATEPEENVTCCYAVQNKVWATDPDGNKWEVYVLLDDDGATHHSDKPKAGVGLSMAGCCVPNAAGEPTTCGTK